MTTRRGTVGRRRRHHGDPERDAAAPPPPPASAAAAAGGGGGGGAAGASSAGGPLGGPSPAPRRGAAPTPTAPPPRTEGDHAMSDHVRIGRVQASAPTITQQRRTGPPRRAKAQQNAKRARVDAAERRSEAKAVFGDGYIEAMKTAIAMDYVVKHRAPDPKYWEGRHGCILAIRKEYHKMMKRRFVKKVLTEVHACILKGEAWAR